MHSSECKKSCSFKPAPIIQVSFKGLVGGIHFRVRCQFGFASFKDGIVANGNVIDCGYIIYIRFWTVVLLQSKSCVFYALECDM